MKRIFTTILATALLAGGAAVSATLTDTIVDKFQDRGFTRIEVKEGVSQIKVEAIKGRRKVEVIYDRETGKVIKRERDFVGADDDRSPGVKVKSVARDFVKDRSNGPRQRRDRDDDDHHGRSDDDHDHHRGSDDDRDYDDDHDHDDGNDDDHDDDD